MKPRNKKGRFIKGVHYSPETEFKKGYTCRKPKPCWNKDWLYEEYIVKKKSTGDIAKELNCKDANILYFLKKFGIPRRTVKETRAIKYWGLSGKNNPMYGKRGEETPGWQGGNAPLRQKLYSRAEWKEIIKKILKRDNYTCQICGAKHTEKNKLVIHHIYPVSSFPEFIDKEWNLATVCEKCHKKLHCARTFRINSPDDLRRLILERKIR